MFKIFFALIGLSVFFLDVQANGREPCDRGAGGIKYCSGKKFICNDGRTSRSSKICDSRVYGSLGKSKVEKER